MASRITGALTAGVVLLLATLAARAAPGEPQIGADAPVTRAVAFLAGEVPRWRREHRCYSCHNNGDAVRALLAASRAGPSIGDALADSLGWLSEPKRWETNAGGEGGGDDKRLARVQFAYAAADAVKEGRVPPRALDDAVTLLAADQQQDGSWRLDTSDSLGSPATYGTALATSMARSTLVRAGGSHGPAIARASAWLSAVKIENTPDAAAVALAATGTPPVSRRAVERAVTFLLRTQGSDGGWGPYATSPAENFDTALAVVALAALQGLAQSRPDETQIESATTRGRAYLRRQQLADGSWVETTRPAGQVSYAQRISTTAWSLLALLE